MQSHEQEEELSLLENELVRYQIILDKSIEANEEFAKTKDIFHEIKKIQIKINEIKQRTKN